MAYTKKTTTKKTTVKKVTKPVEPEIVEEVIDEAEEVAVKEEKKVRVKHDPSDPILCRSITVGKLLMEGINTKMVYRWMDYGDEIEVEYRDLASAVRSHSQFIFAPYFIIEDDAFIEEFTELNKFYNEKFTIKELSEILDMNEGEMEDAISILPKGAKEQFINIVSTKISNGELDSVRKIKALERILNIDFSLVADM